ncbi:SDR family oxidoreductase [Kibdelosporangium philippinense]|uniref:SDR family oxidoreductase n=1 Tax=Kibdelosporangium philippinense TaxID=211113 RepID=A0ABS8Z887_9PSEU|nr:SDR family oxidoreductase [Kibdelosporangium philippinense]MCE7004096.1 SDR family oxidoreductase [Kibdelosporangium philippinense]
MKRRNKPIDLDGAVVAITGGARGIGLETAKAFTVEGAVVFIGDLDGEAAAKAATEFGGEGFALDVRSKKSFADFLSGIERAAGPIDVLVNNAGIMPLGPLVDETDATTEAILDINVLGLLWGLKLVLPDMIERGEGHVVNIASYFGRLPGAGAVTYCASKFAAVGLSESIRDELNGTGVTVSAILPSAVRTDLTSGVNLDGIVPTVDPDRIANAVVHSCKRRRAIIPVPGWMKAYEPIAALTPQPLLAMLRGKLTRKRTIETIDKTARASYDARMRDLERTPQQA